MFRMKGFLLIAGFLLAIGVFVLVVYLPIRATRQWSIDDIDGDLVETYCTLVAEERYADAYQDCLSNAYRKDVSLEDFAAAQVRARESRGILQSREILRIKPGRNLFTGTRDIQLLYRLTYSRGERRDYMVINNADGDWRIEGTYILMGSGLRYEVW